MGFELVKAWKITKSPQKGVSFKKIQVMNHSNRVLKISDRMPHYLRMLTYASQPELGWGPARKEFQYDRYASMNKDVVVSTQETDKTVINEAFNFQDANTCHL